ncbi:MAG: helix-turn-helix domain-containing protein [Pseudomonadota bacterium]
MLASELIHPNVITNQFRSTSDTVSPLLTRKAAAKYLGVAAQTLAQWAVSGRYNLPYISIGRRAMYRQTDLDAFITKNAHVDGLTAHNGWNQ